MIEGNAICFCCPRPEIVCAPPAARVLPNGILTIYRLNEKGRFEPSEFVKGECRLNLAALKDLCIDLDLVFAP